MRKILVVSLILLAAPEGGAATTYLIKPDGTGDFPTIQEALSAAASGDTVLLADGTFTGAGNRNLGFGGKSLVVRSQTGSPSACTIHCQGAGRGFTLVAIPASAKVADITITGGIGDGAAIYCENSFLTIENCFLIDNGVLDRGGGVHCRLGAHPIIRECTITGNESSSGGGIYCYAAGADVFDTIIQNNEAHSVGGGGVWMNVGATLTLTDCTIQSNTSAGEGGGVWCGGSVITPSSLNITGCDISGNESQLGGGLFAHTSLVSVSNTVVGGNFASVTDGGGVYLATSSPTLSQVTIAGNHAAGSGGGAYLYSADATLDHCIVWGDCADGQHDEVSMGGSGSGATFQCCDVSPSAVGGAGFVSFDANCFEADPLFCGASDCSQAPNASGNYQLDSISPAAPPQSPCGLVGALDVGCNAATVMPGVGTSVPSIRPGPNPAAGPIRFLFSAAPGPVHVEFFDASGRVVRRWVEQHSGQGPGFVTWNMENDQGRPVPAGVYFYRLSVGDVTASGSVVRLIR